MKKSIITLSLSLVALVLQAHPGHGSENPLSPGHYLGNPEHALPLTLSIMAAFVLVGWLWYKYANKRA